MTRITPKVKVLDKGFVALDASMADDLSVVNAARVSFAKRSEYERVVIGEYPGRFQLKAEDAGLIRFLMKGRHGTPFEHNAFRFHVKTPIFVAREWMRHRIGSFNEWSGRYSKLEAEFYVPENWRTQTGKPGEYRFEPLPQEVVDANKPVLESVYRYAWDSYEKMLREGMAKEQARLVLPVSIYTQFFWTVNARSLMNFLSLRNADQAMFEIREYAKEIETLFGNLMPVTHQAFIENGRVAP